MGLTERGDDYPDVDIHQFLLDNNLNATVKEIIPLFDYDDSVVAFLHVLQPTGYIIIDSSEGNLIEFSLENESPFSKGESEKFYYGGPIGVMCQVIP